MGNNQNNINNQSNCYNCHLQFTTFNSPKICTKCKNNFCKKCLDYPLLLQEDSQIFLKSDAKIQLPLVLLCLSCLKKHSSLNFDQEVEILGKQYQETIIWLHGGGSCRKMFETHAQILTHKKYRSILMDLPGHGSLMNKQLSIQSCIEQIKIVTQKYCNQSGPPVLIGGSFGGYSIMQIFNRYPEKYKAAIICMCGQNIGEGRSNTASFGLWAMKKAFTVMSVQTLVKSLIKQAKFIQKKELIKMMRAGYYFNQSQNQVEFLKNCSLIKGLKKFKGNILFINGDQDHRDSEQLWLKQSERGQLKVYKGADHFFTHDTRFMQKFLLDCQTFLNKVFRELNNE